MDDANPPLNEATPMLWLLALLLAWLAAHLALGYTRGARRQARASATAVQLAAAAVALGSAVFATMVLVMSGQPVAYSVGYRGDALVGAWVLAVLVSAMPAALICLRPGSPSVVLGAALFGAGAAAAQAAILWAAGLLPGLVWRLETLLLAAVLQALLTAAALWLAFIGPGRSGRLRRRWRAAAAAVLALALIVGPELVLSAGDMATQIASAHAGLFSLRWVKLLAAVGVPLLLVLLAALLHVAGDAAPEADLVPRRRRRRRQRWWAMRP